MFCTVFEDKAWSAGFSSPARFMFNCSRKELNCSYILTANPKEAAPEWNRILPEGHPLKGTEILSPGNRNENMRTMYLLFFQNNACVGLAYLQILTFGRDAFPTDIFSLKGTEWVKSVLLPEKMSLLICGHIFRLDFSGFFFPDPEKENLLLPVLADAGRKLPVSHTLMGTLIKDISEASPLFSKTSVGFKIFKDDLVMDLALRPNWNSFDDYLGDLSKKYRQRAGKIIQQASEIKRMELDLSEIRELEPEIYRLYEMVLERQDIRISRLSRTYFSDNKNLRGENFKVFGYFRDDTLCAFSSHIIKDGGRMELHYIGFHPATNEGFALYFNILFDGLREAIQLKMNTLELGRTSMDAKANLGATERKLFHLYKVKRGLPSLLFRYLNQKAQSEGSESRKERNPLKPQKIHLQPSENG
jgi:hypothetical protein